MIRTPVQAPNANAYAERWVRSVRQECLNHLLIVNERHLHAVLKEYANYYKHRRPHQGLHQKILKATSEMLDQGPIHRSDVLGGITPRLPSPGCLAQENFRTLLPQDEFSHGARGATSLTTLGSIVHDYR